ncbi:MAG: hypothetical protein IPM70_18670 [Proteobacteria bacterium]|nr:hypothetical protein [Pseudomonadota bacterium]
MAPAARAGAGLVASGAGAGTIGAAGGAAAGVGVACGAVVIGTAGAAPGPGDSHSIHASTPRFTTSTAAITQAQGGMRRRGGAMRTSISTGPDCRWRSDSDFFSASRMNDMAILRVRRH